MARDSPAARCPEFSVDRGFSTSALLALGTGSFVAPGHCPVHCGSPGLHPLDASSTPPVMTTPSVPRHCQVSPQLRTLVWRVQPPDSPAGSMAGWTEPGKPLCSLPASGARHSPLGQGTSPTRLVSQLPRIPSVLRASTTAQGQGWGRGDRCGWGQPWVCSRASCQALPPNAEGIIITAAGFGLRLVSSLGQPCEAGGFLVPVWQPRDQS